MQSKVTLESIMEASHRLNGVVRRTQLEFSEFLSSKYGAEIYLKREDLQYPVRSYKIRGAFNAISAMNGQAQAKGVVAASAGNHSQAVAHSCNILGIKGTIFMPRTTPQQKREGTQRFGNGKVDLHLVGDTFDESYAEAVKFVESNGGVFIHPFNEPVVIAGQGTVGKEIIEDAKGSIDYLLVPIGGGGLISGIGSYVSALSPNTRLIGVEPKEAAAMYKSIQAGKLVSLDEFSHFVDGAAVRTVGDLTFEIAKELGYKVELVPEGMVCTTLIDLYNKCGIVAELAGALSIAALNNIKDEIKGKRVVCVLSGGNNDLDRLPEIKERSLMYEGLKHYFIVEFPQRPGALREFLDKALGPNDDITRFEYTKKTAADYGPALVGIQLGKKEDYQTLVTSLRNVGFKFEEISNNNMFLRYFL